MASPMTRLQRIVLASILFLAALARVALTLSLKEKPYFYEPVVDSAAYDRWAQEIARGDVVGKQVFYQDPLYPYFLGAVYKVFGRDLYLVRLLQILLGVAGCWMLFEAARRLGGTAVAFVALAIAALYRPFLFYDTALLKEFLAVVLVETALLCVVLDRKWSWLAAGLALGLAVLIRANLLLVVAILAIFLAIRKRFAPAALVAGGALLAILPVTIRNAVVAKDFVLTTYQLGPNFYIGNHPGNSTGRYVPPPFLTAASPDFEEPDFRAEAERMSRRQLQPSEISSYWTSRTWAEMDGGRFLGLTARRLLEYVNNHEVPDNYNYDFMRRFSWVLRLPLFGFWIVAPLAAAGMVFAWRERGRWGWLYLFVAAYYLSIIPFFVFGRYRLPVVPPLLLFAGLGTVRLFERCRVKRWPWSAGAISAGVLGVALIPIGPRNFNAAHYNLGLYHYQGGSPAAAAAELEHVRHIPHPQWHYLRGLAYEEARDPDRALEAFHEAARLDPISPDAAFHLARAYRAVEAIDDAIHWYETTLRLDTPRLDAWVELGRCRMAKKDWMGAMQAFNGAAIVSWEGNLEKARLYAELGMWPQVVRECDEVLRRSKNQREARELRERALRQ